MSEIHIAPNRPLYVALVDPGEENYNFEHECQTYKTTAGQTLTLPRQGVIALNSVGPKPGEEIQILQQWSGRQTDPRRWVIALSTRTEKNRAAQEATPEAPAAVPPPEATRAIVAPPTPIRRPSYEPDPSLFDCEKSNGTYGPRPVRRSAHRPAPGAIPWNIAFREVTAWVRKELMGNDLQWSDKAQQAMVCTVLIAEAKAGRIGPWERGE